MPYNIKVFEDLSIRYFVLKGNFIILSTKPYFIHVIYNKPIKYIFKHSYSLVLC
jgi:hypothetical protein